MVEAGRARAASLGWPDAYAYTKALGERALARDPRRRAGQHRAAVDHRVGAGRARARLDPRLPHGRAGDHLLRPRPAEGVPRRARGHRRRDPRRPRRRRHHRGRRQGPRRRRRPAPDITQVASGSANPLALPAARRPGAGAGSPSTRSTTPRASRSSCPSGRSPVGAACRRQLERPKRPARTAEKVAAVAAAARASRPSGRPRSRRSSERSSGPSATSSSTARTPSARRSTASTACSRSDDSLDADGPGRLRASTRGSSTGTTTSTEIHLPSVVEHARVRHHAGRGARRDARRPAAAPGAVARPPHRGVRPREHAHRVERRRVVRVARHPAPAPRRQAALRRQDAAPRRPALLELDRRDRSDFLRHFYRRYEGAPVEQLEADAVEMFSELHPRPSRSPPPSGGCASTARSATAPCSSPARSTSSSSRSRPLFDDIVCARMLAPTTPTARYTGQLTDVPPTGESRAPGAVRLRRGARPRPAPSRSPTPTRPATCPCSRSSASRSP